MARPTVAPSSAPSRRIGRRIRAGLTAGAAIILSLVFLGGVIGCTTTPADTVPSAITIVATATSAEPRVALPDSLVTELTDMAKQSKRTGDATVRIVTSATGGTAGTRDLTPMRSNGQVQHAPADADRQIASAVNNLADLAADAQADQPSLDALGLLDHASELPGDIAFVSSGISTAAPVDLRVIGWGAKPDSIIDSIVRQGRLPNLSGRHVTFYGLGVAAGSQPSLPPFARTLVEQLWTGICQRAGAASCVVAHDAPSPVAPVATLPVPVVPVPDAITEGGCPVWASLSDATLHFAPESATLPANADDALSPIVQAASRCNVQSINITGHIADTGSGRDDTDLSGRRAHAVADRLVALGLPIQTLGLVTGKGAAEPVIPNLVNGAFDEQRAEQNRRVELIFHRAGR
ncbi:OmpA family protein [Nocardia niigatensis]